LQNAVCGQVERDDDLGQAARRGREVGEAEEAKALVVLCKLALALNHVDFHARLPVRGGGKGLRLRGGRRRVAGNELGGHAAQRLDAQAQRRDVQQHDILQLAAQHRSLHGGAQRDHLVRVDGYVRRLAGQLPHHRLHARDAGGAAHHDHVVQVLHAELGVLDGALQRPLAAVKEVLAQHFELCARQRGVDVLRPVLRGGHERDVDCRAGEVRQLLLRLDGCFRQALHGGAVLAQIDADQCLEVVREPVNDAAVKVVAAQMRVAARGEDLEHSSAHAEKRDVERAAAQVEHKHRLCAAILAADVQAVDSMTDRSPSYPARRRAPRRWAH